MIYFSEIRFREDELVLPEQRRRNPDHLCPRVLRQPGIKDA
jgi:hypothetical protein